MKTPGKWESMKKDVEIVFEILVKLFQKGFVIVCRHTL